MNIILIGPQGSGKGTQAENIAEHYGNKHFSTGDAFRHMARSGTELGKKLANIMEKGELVPDEMVDEVVAHYVQEHKHEGLIFDGFPRTVKQAQYLDSITHIEAVVDINISDEEAVRRIAKRFSCPKCGESYNTKSNPPKETGICDNDGEQLTQRKDDNEEAVRKRLKAYHEKTEPLIQHYKEKGTPVHVIDGEQPIDNVFIDVQKALGEKKVA